MKTPLSPVSPGIASTRSLRALGFPALLLAVAALPAHAQTRTWDGSENTSWENALNWSGDNAPDTTGEDVLIDNDGGVVSSVILNPANGTTLDIGSLTIDSDDTLNVRFDSGTFNITGGLSNSGTLSHSQSPSSNVRTAHLNVSGTNQIFNTSTGVISILNNTGRNRVSTVMTLDAQNQNDGAITASMTANVSRDDKALFRLENSGVFTNNGTILLQNTPAFNVSNPTFVQLQLLTSGAAVTLGGTGSVTLDVGTQTDVRGARIADSGGGALTNGINHTIDGAGLVDTATIVNDGLMHATGDTATLRVDADTSITNSSSGRMVAAGVAGLNIGSGSIDFTNNGHLEARSGSIVAISTSNATLNGVVAGGGHFSTGIALSDTATLAAGDFSNADGTGSSTVGTLEVSIELAFQNATKLSFQLGDNAVAGTDYDTIAVAGSLTLDGILDVTEESGFGSGTYRLITFNSGELTDNGLELGTMPVGGYTYELVVSDVGGFVDLVVAVPEPSAFALLLGGAALLCVAGRKRRQL